MIGFLEESEGVKSMTRLTVLWMSVLASAIVGTTCYCVLKGKITEGIVLALGGMLLTIVAKGATAIITRNPAESEK